MKKIQKLLALLLVVALASSAPLNVAYARGKEPIVQNSTTTSDGLQINTSGGSGTTGNKVYYDGGYQLDSDNNTKVNLELNGSDGDFISGNDINGQVTNGTVNKEQSDKIIEQAIQNATGGNSSISAEDAMKEAGYTWQQNANGVYQYLDKDGNQAFEIDFSQVPGVVVTPEPPQERVEEYNDPKPTRNPQKQEYPTPKPESKPDNDIDPTPTTAPANDITSTPQPTSPPVHYCSFSGGTVFNGYTYRFKGLTVDGTYSFLQDSNGNVSGNLRSDNKNNEKTVIVKNETASSGLYQKDDYTGLNLTYTAKWDKIGNYTNWSYCNCGRGGSSDYTRTEGTITQSVPVFYDAVLNYPEYIQPAALDLTTHGNADMSKINIQNRPYTNLENADGYGSASISVSYKNNFAAGEVLSLLNNNKYTVFQIDFKDTWFGVPSSYNLLGGNQYKVGKGDGFQWVSWAKMYYGADHLQDLRTTKINSITKLGGNSKSETVSTESMLLSNSGSIVGKQTFYLRSIKPSETNYNLGFSQNNCWVTYFDLCRNNSKGVKWNVSYSSTTPNSLTVSIVDKDYNDYVMYATYEQPILYGEYSVKTSGGF